MGHSKSVVVLFTIRGGEGIHKIEDKLKNALISEIPGITDTVVFDTSLCSEPESKYLGELCANMEEDFRLDDNPGEDEEIIQVLALDFNQETVNHVSINYLNEVPMIILKR